MKNESKAPAPKKGYTKHQSLATTKSGGKVVDNNTPKTTTGPVHQS